MVSGIKLILKICVSFAVKYTFGTVNSIFIEIQPDSTNIKNDPRTYKNKMDFFIMFDIVKKTMP